MYFTKIITQDSRSIHESLKMLTKTNRLVLVSIISGLAAVFQAAAGFFPGVGYIISPLATAPIIFCTILSIRLGLMSYLLSVLMLLIIQPSELIVFPFTTGLLGLGVGYAFLKYKKRLGIIMSGCAALSLGIIIVLYAFNFPLLGPAASTSFNPFAVGGIFLFAIIYSWIWVEVSVICFKRLKIIFAS